MGAGRLVLASAHLLRAGGLVVKSLGFGGLRRGLSLNPVLPVPSRPCGLGK